MPWSRSRETMPDMTPRYVSLYLPGIRPHAPDGQRLSAGRGQRRRGAWSDTHWPRCGSTPGHIMPRRTAVTPNRRSTRMSISEKDCVGSNPSRTGACHGAPWERGGPESGPADLGPAGFGPTRTLYTAFTPWKIRSLPSSSTRRPSLARMTPASRVSTEPTANRRPNAPASPIRALQ